MKFIAKALLLIAVSCKLLLAQAVSRARPITFHVQGRISTAFDSLPGGVDDKGEFIPLPRTEVTFYGEHAIKTVMVDEKGFYEIDLPPGIYKMTAKGPKIGQQALTPYSRLFRANSHNKIVINGTLYLAHMTCDVMAGGTSEQKTEITKNLCGGEDSFRIPSREGTPLELYIRYSKRKATDKAYLYGGEWHPDHIPVFIAYNLFSLEADSVSYDRKKSLLSAAGNVSMQDASGKLRHFDSIDFKIERGQVITLPGIESGNPKYTRRGP